MYVCEKNGYCIGKQTVISGIDYVSIQECSQEQTGHLLKRANKCNGNTDGQIRKTDWLK